MQIGELYIEPRRPREGLAVQPTETGLRLQAKAEWKVHGPEAALDQICAALPGKSERLHHDLLLLSFGNSAGYFRVPFLGTLDVYCGKWGRSHFERMLHELSEIASALPFAATGSAALPFDRSVTAEQDVLYHAFVYLRHIVTEAEGDNDLLAAYRTILRDPHQRLVRSSRYVPPYRVAAISPRAVQEIVTGSVRLLPVPAGTPGPLVAALRGRLPEQILEDVSERCFDTAENRFVLAFLGQALWIIEQMAAHAESARLKPAVAHRITDDCEQLRQRLQPVANDRFWRQVGPMITVPQGSTVLQRRRGYRQVLRHFARLRMAARVPIPLDQVQRLLEIKDIAALYELWCYFTVVHAVKTVKGEPELASTVRYDELAAGVEHSYQVAWPDRLKVTYNPSYSRRRKQQHSYSVSLRPDIAIEVPDGPNSGLHLLDAKLKIDQLSTFIGDLEDDPEGTDAAIGTFKRADLYKMHTYRDAIPATRSVWVLYPGTEQRFFSKNAGEAGLPVTLNGVGAIPLRPEPGEHTELTMVMARLLRPFPG